MFEEEEGLKVSFNEVGRHPTCKNSVGFTLKNVATA
jgi:hypothetical protein